MSSIHEVEYTIFWFVKEEDKVQQYGVGLAAWNSLVAYINVPSSTTKHLMTLQLNTVSRPISIISVYIPILMASDNLRETFYDELRTAMHVIPTKQCIYILGDFNARVGSNHASWPHQLRHNGVTRVNENGQRILELHTEFDLCITNTYFCDNREKECHGIIPTLVTWHQHDLVLA